MKISSAHEESIIDKQASINIGMIGHVANGKSTLVKSISGSKTTRFRQENIRSSTIKLGYANAKIYKCPTCPEPSCYQSFSSDTFSPDCKHCTTKLQLKRHISFVDCPGHDILMATMLNGASVMDAGILLIAANEPCPQPQTLEHMAAVEISDLDNILVAQNKIDLVNKSQCLEQLQSIKDFLLGTKAADSPIVPLVAKLEVNIDVICERLCNWVKEPERDLEGDPEMMIVRSFDINRAGTDLSELQGGIAGGTLLKGMIKEGDEIEIRPGIITQNKDGLKCKPINTKVVSIMAEKNKLEQAVPGGLIAIGTNIDPYLTRADRLVGQVLGLKGKLPPVFKEIQVSFFLINRVIGASATDGNKKKKRVERIKPGQHLMLHVGSMATTGVVLKDELEKKKCWIKLKIPVCSHMNKKIAISRKVDDHWRLIGCGTIENGKEYEYLN
eukprot:GAHX01000889.1.p1 GENE.GAHX01000889.1~~GAHX01000889.1.p1  ORF type:complete len:443 (-),score=74.56 GAHX01000889.1:26-1354(-)